MHGSFNLPVLSFRNAELADDRRRDRLAHAEEAVCRWTSEIAQKHYPGHPWRIEADIRQRIVKIQLAPWMGPNNWYVLTANSAANTFVFEQRVKQFCGEILERYGVPRSNFSMDHWRAAAELIPVHRKFHGFLPS